MLTKPNFTLNLGELLLKHRWWFVAMTILIILIFETLEYQPHLEGINIFFLFEVIFYGIILPASTGIALSQLAARRTELAWSTYYLNLQRNLRIQLNNAHTQDELANVLMQFFRVVMPLIGVTLLVYDQRARYFKTILTWFQKEEINFQHLVLNSHANCCPHLTDLIDDQEKGLQPCCNPWISSSFQGSPFYCMPFFLSTVPAGFARFLFQPNSSPSPEQTRLLREISPDIASAFKRIQLEQLVQTQNDSVNAEQQRIARDVHDSLGHSLAFLRLKLDQITMEYKLAETQSLRREVESLRDLAKEAYDQMRDVLVALTPENDPNLNNVLQNFADRFRQRASFKLQLRIDGRQRILPPIVRHHIFYIFYEALTNIEKHAHARQVEVNLGWKESYLTITIVDDGLGFDAAQPKREGHFGLTNIHERALASRAQLDIFSEIGHGTQLILCVPYEVEV